MSAEENNTLVLFFPERLEASSPLKELLVYIDSICNKKLENRIFTYCLTLILQMWMEFSTVYTVIYLYFINNVSPKCY